MIAECVSLICDTLDVVGQPEPAPGAVGGPLWKRKIPGSLEVVPFIRDFARLGYAKLDLNGRHLATLKLTGEPVVSDTAASVPYTRKAFNQTVQACTAVVPFSCHDKAESLLTGEWTDFGRVKVRLGSLIPKVTWEKSTIWEGDDAVIRWETSPGARAWGPAGLIEWSAQIPEIRIGEFKGRVIFSRAWMTAFAPDAEWA